MSKEEAARTKWDSERQQVWHRENRPAHCGYEALFVFLAIRSYKLWMEGAFF
jgi:hypothetical protein